MRLRRRSSPFHVQSDEERRKEHVVGKKRWNIISVKVVACATYERERDVKEIAQFFSKEADFYEVDGVM